MRAFGKLGAVAGGVLPKENFFRAGGGRGRGEGEVRKVLGIYPRTIRCPLCVRVLRGDVRMWVRGCVLSGLQTTWTRVGPRLAGRFGKMWERGASGVPAVCQRYAIR